MKIALVLTGVLATVGMVAPMLIPLGFLFFIIPGLILLCAPTVFTYLAATMAIRWSLPYESNLLKTAIGFVGAIVAGCAVMVPWNYVEVAKYESKLLPDIAADQPIALSGDVLIERKNQIVGHESEWCDYLCASILEIPEVTTVTANYKRNTATFKLVSAEQNPAPGLLPFEPGKILSKSPETMKSTGLVEHDQQRIADKSVEASWILRLAKESRLVTVSLEAEDQPDWIVRVINQTKRGKPVIKRIEIVDSDGKVCYRKSHVNYDVPSKLFYFGFDIIAGSGTISDCYFQVGKYNLRTDDNIPQLELEETLLSNLQVPVPDFDQQNLVELRAEVGRVLDDPNAADADIELVRRWLSTFYYDASESDYPLIEKAVTDSRIENITESLKKICHKKETPGVFWVAFAKRIAMSHSTSDDRYWYARKLATMPDGTFAEPEKIHWKIWNRKSLSRQASPFIERLADLGPEQGTTELMDALEDALLLASWGSRRNSVEAVRKGLDRLGPGAIEAAPRIKQLMGFQRSPIMNTWKDRKGWESVLDKMGAVAN